MMNLQGYAPQQGTNSGQSMFNLGSTQQRPQATNYQKQFMNNGGQPSLGSYGANNQPNQNASFNRQPPQRPMYRTAQEPMSTVAPMSRDAYMQRSMQPNPRGPGARDYRRMMMERARRRYMMQNRGY